MVCAPKDEAVLLRSLLRWTHSGVQDIALQHKGWVFILNSFRGGRQSLSRAVAAAIDQTGDTFLMNVMQELRGFAAGEASGFIAGKADGFTEGEASGAAKAKAAVLAEQMRLKFGELPPGRVAQVEDASPEELDRWLKRLIVADTLDGVFLDRH